MENLHVGTLTKSFKTEHYKKNEQWRAIDSIQHFMKHLLRHLKAHKYKAVFSVIIFMQL